MQRFTWLILLLCMLNIASAQQATSEVFRYVEHMPEPGYNVNQYLAANVHYPDSAIKNNIQGRVIVQFVVMDNGGIDSVKVVGKNKFGYGLEDEAIRVITAMPAWKPGEQNGKKVNVYFNQPISFKLEDEEKDTVYKYVEVMPEAEYNVNQYLASQMHYPAEARQYGIEGRVLVNFVIMENGAVDRVRLMGNKLGGGCDEEAIRVVKSMPPWKSGSQNGTPVKVYFNLPIQFSLGGGEQEANGIHPISYGDVMPYPDYKLSAFVATHLEYPAEAEERNIHGRVVVKFMVTETGAIDKVSVISPVIGGGCEEAAMKLVKSFPPWKPATHDGKPVKAYTVQTIGFNSYNSAENEKNAAGH